MLISSKNKSNRSYRRLSTNTSIRKLKLSVSPSQKICSSSSIATPSKTIKFKNIKNKPVCPSFHKITIQVQNQELFRGLFAYPFRMQVERLCGQLKGNETEMLVLSKIQQFYFQYNNFYASHYSKTKIIWLIISNAVNRQETESEFNLNYEPITFFFVSSLKDVVNWINFRNTQKQYLEIDLNYFSSIVNYQAYLNQYAVIQESQIKFINLSKNNQLALINTNDLLKLAFKDSNNYYFLNQSLIHNGKIKIISTTEKIIYVLDQGQQIFLGAAGILQMENSLKKEDFKRKLATPKQKIYYYQKIVKKYLFDEVIYCLVSFPIQIVKLFEKQANYVISTNQKLFVQGSHIMTVYFEQNNMKESHIHQVLFIKENQNQNQIKRIMVKCQKIKKLVSRYDELKKYKILSVYFLAYGLQKNQAIITQMSQYSSLKIISISVLNDIKQFYDRSIIIIGVFNEQQNLFLHQFRRVYKIDIIGIQNGQQAMNFIHQALIAKLDWLGKQQNSAISTNCTMVVSFNLNLDQMQLDGEIYRSYCIQQFEYALWELKNGTSVVLLMQMEQYSQERQQKLKQSQFTNNLNFNVYLKYGNQFISRSRNNKYTFLKKQQLLHQINTIRQNNLQKEQSKTTTEHHPIINTNIPMDLQSQSYVKKHKTIYTNSQHRMKSDILYDNSPYLTNQYSTPILNYYQTNRQLLICIPKTLPYHSLVNRSSQPYTLLIYSNLDQVKHLTKYLTNQHFLAIIALQTENMKNIDNSLSAKFQYILVRELSQRIVRDEIDHVVLRLGLSKQSGSLCKNKKGTTAVILFNQKDQIQNTMIKKMKGIFSSSKVITIGKSQFKEMKRQLQISNKLQVFQMGKAQISQTKRIQHIIDLFKIFMSPVYSNHTFTSQNLQFTIINFFVSLIKQKIKKMNMPNSLKELSLSRSLSPRGRNLIPKDTYIHEAGLLVLESDKVNRLVRKQTFKTEKQFIGLTINGISTGNYVLVIFQQAEFQGLRKRINSKVSSIILIIVTQNPSKIIFRSSNIVFCLIDQLQQTVRAIHDKFKIQKQLHFQIVTKDSSLKHFIADYQHQLLKNQRQVELIKGSVKQQIKMLLDEQKGNISTNSIKFILDEQIKEIQINKIPPNAIIIKNSTYFNQIMYNLANSKVQSKQNYYQQQTKEIHFPVWILCQTHNKKFIEQSIKVIEETNAVIATFQDIMQVFNYHQMERTVLVLERQISIRSQFTLLVDKNQTPFIFSRRLKLFIEALRKGK